MQRTPASALFTLSLVGGLVVVAGLIALFRQQSTPSSPDTSPTPTASATPTPSPSPTPASAYTYPLTAYSSRLTLRTYGKKVAAEDKSQFPCGDSFTGYHTGDDLETTDAEKSTSVPVFAIAAGTVRQVSTVSGYGGLIVIEHAVSDQKVTAYYGHVSVSTALVKAGDTVVDGQPIAELGGQCKSSSGGERQHLHFAIREGSDIDVRGYAPTEEGLSRWMNPAKTLVQLTAKEPQ